MRNIQAGAPFPDAKSTFFRSRAKEYCPMSSTMKEVANQAGVSTATVSRVLNGSNVVNEVTRRRVLEVAEALQYMPSAMGRILSTRKTEAVGLLLPDIHGEFFSE